MKIKEASKYSIYNMPELESSIMAGCCCSKSIFEFPEISKTTDIGKAAMYPKCGPDSVLPELANFKLAQRTLTNFKTYWF